MTFGNTRQFYSKTPEFWPVTEVFTWQQLISPSFTCVFGVCVHISLCKLSVALPLELAGERFTQCCCKFAGLHHSFEGWRTGGRFVGETQSDGPMDSHQSAPIPTESWGHFTDDWWKCPSCVYSASQWWLYQMLFFFFFLPVLWSLLCPGRRTENPFVMLNCKEHAFSHSTGSFCKNVLSGHHVGPENPAVLLGRQMPWKNYIA